MEDLDLLSLPSEILAKIFSNIPWNKLINVKLTARKFNFITEKYFKDMQKPRLCEVEFDDINTCYKDTGKVTVTYKIFITGANGFEDISDERKFSLLPSELDQLHSFLKNVDLTSLRRVDFTLDSQTKVMRIFSEYFNNTNRIETICVTVTHYDKEVDNPLSFLGKVQNVGELELDLRFPNRNVPRNFIIPVRNALKKLNISEEEDTSFINPRMIKYIVENNPDLDVYILSFDTFETYKMVIQTIVKGKLSRRCNGYPHKHVSLFLDIFDFEETFELLSYFNSEEFPYNGTSNEYRNSLYYGSLECPVCGGSDSIEICDVEDYDD